MVDVTPQTRITIKVAKSEIFYISGKTKLSYGEIVGRIQMFLEFLKENITNDVKNWIDRYVPKRTGQLREMLKRWVDGSNIYKNVLRIVVGTNLPYASVVNEMTTDMVRHSGEIGYVYYPNLFGIRGKIQLWDPEAIGAFFTVLLEYMKERAELWIARGKEMLLKQPTGRENGRR